MNKPLKKNLKQQKGKKDLTKSQEILESQKAQKLATLTLVVLMLILMLALMLILMLVLIILALTLAVLKQTPTQKLTIQEAEDSKRLKNQCLS